MHALNLIYLDYNATTPTDPRVVDKLLPYFYEIPGNAASRSHPFGWQAEEAVKQAREEIANLIQVESREIVFTSGATEAINLALKGLYGLYKSKGNHFVTAKSEHKAVLDTCEKIEKMGGSVTYLDVNEKGLIDIEELRNAITDKTIAVSLMWANNEIGVIQPMHEVGKVCAEKNVLCMSDATQAVGKIAINPKEAGVHLMALSGHKFYGPKGIGALYVSQKNPRIRLASQIDGGGHEKGMRSGTLNVPGIVGLGEAARIAYLEMKKEGKRLAILRDKLETALLEIEESYINGSTIHRLPHITNMSFRHVEGEKLMSTFNQTIAVSSGSACTSATLDPSHVLVALGLSEEMAHASLRFSLGRFTTEEEIDIVILKVKEGVNYLRSISPVWEMWKDGLLED